MTEDTNQSQGTINVGGQDYKYSVFGNVPRDKETIGEMIASIMRGSLEETPPPESQPEKLLFVFNGRELSRAQAEVVVAIDMAHDIIEGNFADFVEILLDSGFTPVAEFSDEDLSELLSAVNPENFTEKDMALISDLEPTQPEENINSEKEELKIATEKLKMIQVEAQKLLKTVDSTLNDAYKILENI